jgi:hypothetical protein
VVLLYDGMIIHFLHYCRTILFSHSHSRTHAHFLSLSLSPSPSLSPSLPLSPPLPLPFPLSLSLSLWRSRCICTKYVRCLHQGNNDACTLPHIHMMFCQPSMSAFPRLTFVVGLNQQISLPCCTIAICREHGESLLLLGFFKEGTI